MESSDLHWVSRGPLPSPDFLIACIEGPTDAGPKGTNGVSTNGIAANGHVF